MKKLLKSPFFHLYFPLMVFLCSTVQAEEHLFSIPFAELSRIRVIDNSASLTKAAPKEIPASVTVISQEDIQRSGARNLDELLEIYVPGFAYMYKAQGAQMGIRGIISDRNNKILLTVNGRSMEVHASDGGAVTERWFSMLGDIRRITVVSGPGSSVFGPGAIAGVINIETFTSDSFTGAEVTLRGGAVENFATGEMKYALKLNDNLGLFAYYGLDKATGAADSQAPHKLAFTYNNKGSAIDNMPVIEADTNFPFATTRDGASWNEEFRHKAHLQLTGRNFELWGRYTHSGQAIPSDQLLYYVLPPEKLSDSGVRNQQWTAFGQYNYKINKSAALDLSLSYMLSDVDIVNPAPLASIGNRNWAEEETIARMVLHYTPRRQDSLVVGSEYAYYDFGAPSHMSHETRSRIHSLPDGTRWSADMFSLFSEYQLHLGDQWTMFTDLRADKHRFSPWMFSPRLAAVFLPDDRQTWKFIYNRAVRHSDDADLHSIYVATGTEGDVEKIDHFEVILQQALSKKFSFHLSGNYNHHQVVSYNDATKLTEYIGTLDFYCIEGQLTYKDGRLEVQLSHSYTKQLDFDLSNEAIIRQNISASPEGYGNDLANWNNNMTKVRINWQLLDSLNWFSSLRIFWGMPGAVDLADYNRAALQPVDNVISWYKLPLYDSSTRFAGVSAYLDTGLILQASDNLSLSIHGYNLLGLFDEDLNKRNYFQRTSQYRDAAPSVAVRLTYSFH